VALGPRFQIKPALCEQKGKWVKSLDGSKSFPTIDHEFYEEKSREIRVLFFENNLFS